MAFVPGILAAVNAIRGIPTTMGLRGSRVYLRCGEWTPTVGAAEIGKGALTNTDEELLPRPRVEDMPGQRLRVGPITPSHTGGGYSAADLSPDRVDGQDNHILVTKDDVTRAYRVSDIDTEPERQSVSFFLILDPLDSGGPF